MSRFIQALKASSVVELILHLALVFLAAAAFALEGSDVTFLGFPAVRIGWAFFGACLAAEVAIGLHHIRSNIRSVRDYIYLDSGAGIWDRAMSLVKGAGTNCQILGTTSGRNDWKFEREIMEKLASGGVRYRRIMCYASPSSAVMDLGFPKLDEITGNTREDKAKSYIKWYRRFAKHWEAGPPASTKTSPEEFNLHAMRHWENALERVETKMGLDLTHHDGHLTVDFLILRLEDGHCEAAIMAFPTRKNEPMKSGLFTRNHQLANDFSHNLERLLSREALH